MRAVRGGRRRVEGRVFDVVTHELDGLLVARLFDVEEGAAVAEPELAVLGRVQSELEVHELLRRSYLELDSLEDRLDRVALEAEEALHALRVDGACAHPLFDSGTDEAVGALLHPDERLAAAIEEVADQQVLVPEPNQCGAREVGEGEVRVEGGPSSRREGSIRFSWQVL